MYLNDFLFSTICVYSGTKNDLIGLLSACNLPQVCDFNSLQGTFSSSPVAFSQALYFQILFSSKMLYNNEDLLGCSSVIADVSLKDLLEF